MKLRKNGYQQTRKADKEWHKHTLRVQQNNMQPDLRMHICKHIIHVLQHKKDVNQKQHICVKHDFVQLLIFTEIGLPNRKPDLIVKVAIVIGYKMLARKSRKWSSPAEEQPYVKVLETIILEQLRTSLK
ncbi:hypothetical protein TNCV_4101871 [Trichonephila clavipes]|nr:hypothetical protein TNCV_4101871 [Trichonephila clavipes]